MDYGSFSVRDQAFIIFPNSDQAQERFEFWMKKGVSISQAKRFELGEDEQVEVPESFLDEMARIYLGLRTCSSDDIETLLFWVGEFEEKAGLFFEERLSCPVSNDNFETDSGC